MDILIPHTTVLYHVALNIRVMGEKKEKEDKMKEVSDFYEGDDQWYTIDEYLDEEEEEEGEAEEEERRDEA